MKKEIDLYDPGLKQAIVDLPFASSISNAGDMIFIPESDYGFAEIYRMYDNILVFLIPTYGGIPCFYMSFGLHAVDGLIKDLKKLS